MAVTMSDFETKDKQFVIGFTGSPAGMTDWQKEKVVEFLIKMREEHGYCATVHEYEGGANDEFGIMSMNQAFHVIVTGESKEPETYNGTCAFDEVWDDFGTYDWIDKLDVLVCCPITIHESKDAVAANMQYAIKHNITTQTFFPRKLEDEQGQND